MDLLIPFGRSNKTNEYIEPEDAERGRACDCRCPECGTPLLSRHPKDETTRIHFAHDSRHPDAVPSVISECPFNGSLAIVLMARNLANTNSLNGHTIHCPDLHVKINHECCKNDVQIKITKNNKIIIEKTEVAINKFGNTFDFRINFGSHSILIWLEYTDRPHPYLNKEQFSELEEVGLLCIDINSFSQHNFARGKGRFSEAVRDFILSNGKRKWVYHPRTKIKVDKARKDHHCKVPQIEEYQCLKCKAKWIYSGYGKPLCPEGCGYLFSQKIS